MTRTTGLDRWWPTTQALELVRGSVEKVATAVRRELQRAVSDEPLAEDWIAPATIDDAFSGVTSFTSVPTVVLAFPTDSDWTVLWSNGLHCNGYDALCAGLTRLHGYETIHFSAHDEPTTTGPAASFTRRQRVEGRVVERTVQSWCAEGQWAFLEAGPPLPQESVQTYLAPEMGERLNERVVVDLLSRLGAHPWDESFYRLAPDLTFRIERTTTPPTITRRAPNDVLLSTKTPVGTPDLGQPLRFQ